MYLLLLHEYYTWKVKKGVKHPLARAPGGGRGDTVLDCSELIRFEVCDVKTSQNQIIIDFFCTVIFNLLYLNETQEIDNKRRKTKFAFVGFRC